MVAIAKVIERRSRHLMYTAFAPMLPVSVKPLDKLTKDLRHPGQQIQFYLGLRWQT